MILLDVCIRLYLIQQALLIKMNDIKDIPINLLNLLQIWDKLWSYLIHFQQQDHLNYKIKYVVSPAENKVAQELFMKLKL